MAKKYIPLQTELSGYPELDRAATAFKKIISKQKKKKEEENKKKQN